MSDDPNYTDVYRHRVYSPEIERYVTDNIEDLKINQKDYLDLLSVVSHLSASLAETIASFSWFANNDVDQAAAFQKSALSSVNSANTELQKIVRGLVSRLEETKGDV